MVVAAHLNVDGEEPIEEPDIYDVSDINSDKTTLRRSAFDSSCCNCSNIDMDH